MPTRRISRTSGGLVLVTLLVGAAAAPGLDRWRQQASAGARVEALAAALGAVPRACAASMALGHGGGLAPFAGALASWQTIGGCGAGASSGVGAGVKWIGRNVSGGLFHVECQSSYVGLDDGYMYSVNTMVSRHIGDKWSLAASVPWLYKYWKDPDGLGYDLSNEGVGDVSLLLTRRFGAINATSITATVGLPTGPHNASYRDPMNVLRQDKQLGHGRVTGGLIVDHTIDNDWGPLVIGATVNHRGGENELKNYRAPNASAYAHAAYLLGPLAPAIGVTVTRFLSLDKNTGRDQDSPLTTVAPSASLEWSTDWFALLVGGTAPYDLAGNREAWMVSLGLSLSPF